MPLEKVRKVLKIAKEPLSLETPIGDEEDSHLGDFIEDKNAILPIDAAIQSNLRETTTRVLASLTPREERVLRMRFGIGMNTDHTLEEVGQQFSVTRERIRQIEAKALRKLKHPSRSQEAAELPGQLMRLAMPTISWFYGIAIRMYFVDHPPPHFQAVYGEHEANVSIATGEVIAGDLPGTAARLVKQWTLAHQAELQANSYRPPHLRQSLRFKGTRFRKLLFSFCS